VEKLLLLVDLMVSRPAINSCKINMPCSHFYSPCSDVVIKTPVVSLIGAVPTEAVPALKCIAAVGDLLLYLYFLCLFLFLRVYPTNTCPMIKPKSPSSQENFYVQTATSPVRFHSSKAA
jgi:hypothetical protein